MPQNFVSEPRQGGERPVLLQGTVGIQQDLVSLLKTKKRSHENGSYANDLSWKVAGLNHLSRQHLTPLEYIFKRFHEFALFCFANCFDCEGCIKISLLSQLGQMLLKRYTIGSSSKFELKDGNRRTFRPTDRPKLWRPR